MPLSLLHLSLLDRRCGNVMGMAEGKMTVQALEWLVPILWGRGRAIPPAPQRDKPRTLEGLSCECRGAMTAFSSTKHGTVTQSAWAWRPLCLPPGLLSVTHPCLHTMEIGKLTRSWPFLKYSSGPDAPIALADMLLNVPLHCSDTQLGQPSFST